MTDKQTIKHPEFIRLLAQDSGYKIYEVTDIFESFWRVLTRELTSGNVEAIKVKNFGTVKLKKGYARSFTSKLDGITYNTYTKDTVILKPDNKFVELLNENKDGNQAVDLDDGLV